MRYRKLLIEFKPFPKRFYRVIKVREDLDLFTLGTTLITALGGAFDHYFVFISKNGTFVPENFRELYDEKMHYMTDYHLTDLGDKFTLLYDTGDSYEFNVKVYDKVENIRSRKYGFFMDGAGQGIWEDNLKTLLGYLTGELDPNISEDDEKGEYALPWNHHVNRLGDFDFTFDIKEKADRFDIDIRINLDELEENDKF